MILFPSGLFWLKLNLLMENANIFSTNSNIFFDVKFHLSQSDLGKHR